MTNTTLLISLEGEIFRKSPNNILWAEMVICSGYQKRNRIHWFCYRQGKFCASRNGLLVTSRKRSWRVIELSLLTGLFCLQTPLCYTTGHCIFVIVTPISRNVLSSFPTVLLEPEGSALGHHPLSHPHILLKKQFSVELILPAREHLTLSKGTWLSHLGCWWGRYATGF